MALLLLAQGSLDATGRRLAQLPSGCLRCSWCSAACNCSAQDLLHRRLRSIW
jgi:hypothetical protein